MSQQKDNLEQSGADHPSTDTTTTSGSSQPETTAQPTDRAAGTDLSTDRSPAVAARKKKNPSSTSGSSRRGRASYWAYIFLFLLILVLGLGGVLGVQKFNQQQQQIRTLAEETGAAKRDAQTFKQLAQQTQDQVRILRQAQNAQRSNAEQEQQKLSDRQRLLQQQLNLAQRRIELKKGGTEQPTLRAEADFLLRSAQLRLALTGDTQLTERLLDAADRRLARLEDVKVIPVREALTRDLVRLKAATSTDLTGDYLKLTALIDTAAQLPLADPVVESRSATVVSARSSSAATEEPGWFSRFRSTSVRVAKKWFKVTRHELAIKPSLLPEQKLLIRQRLELLLQQSQWALLKHNAALFSDSVKRSRSLLKQYYLRTDPAVRSLREQLLQLNIAQLHAKAPDQLQSIAAMAAYLAAIRADEAGAK